MGPDAAALVATEIDELIATARTLRQALITTRGTVRAMCFGRGIAVLCALAALPLVGCGGGRGHGFGCAEQTCKATFQGPGQQDLSSELGSDATVEVITVDARSVTARIADRDVKLIENEAHRIAGLKVTLTEVDGEDVTLRIIGQ